MKQRHARFAGTVCALALSVGAGALIAAPAEGEVIIGAQTISLQVPGAGATVERAPFRISFNGAGAEPALSEVPNIGALALPRSVIDPAPEPDGSTLYAPLAFLVGSDRPRPIRPARSMATKQASTAGTSRRSKNPAPNTPHAKSSRPKPTVKVSA